MRETILSIVPKMRRLFVFPKIKSKSGLKMYRKPSMKKRPFETLGATEGGKTSMR
jgi:hypothetical protein